MSINTSLYSHRFQIIEIISYFLILVPWAGDLAGSTPSKDNVSGIAVKIALSTAVAVFIVLLRDVRKKIHSLDMLKQGLAQATIHDLKGPLSSIIAVLSIISEQDMELEKKEQLLKVAVSSSKSMEKLVQILVDTERMEIAKMNLQKQNLSLPQFLKECTEIFIVLSADRGIKLTLHVEGATPPMYADRDLLRRTFENLILNAFKYSDNGGEIAVYARYTEGIFYFEVRDKGTGISPEYLDKVFEKYYRVNSSETESRQGSGLGLYFCRLAIEAHGGKIAIDSSATKGTRVLFEIPRETAPETFPWPGQQRDLTAGQTTVA